jgi:hypothetical protein
MSVIDQLPAGQYRIDMAIGRVEKTFPGASAGTVGMIILAVYCPTIKIVAEVEDRPGWSDGHAELPCNQSRCPGHYRYRYGRRLGTFQAVTDDYNEPPRSKLRGILSVALV